MDLSSTYLGLRLRTPLMPGASPMVDDLDVVKRLEDAGAAAIVMHSLFEEQLRRSAGQQVDNPDELYADGYAQTLGQLPRPEQYRLDPVSYLNQLDRIKQSVSIPVIASLNGTRVGKWLDYASMMEQAGADALELNIYQVATDSQESASAVEERMLDVVRAVADRVAIPLAVKLLPFYTSLASFACEVERAGAEGLVLFNRFAQPDIDIETLDMTPRLPFSDPSELLLRLRWVSILSSQVSASLAISGGVHSERDVVKSVMAGAEAVQIVSALLEHGPEYLAAIERGLRQWMEKNGYETVRQMRGSMSTGHCGANPQAFERAQYVRSLQNTT